MATVMTPIELYKRSQQEGGWKYDPRQVYNTLLQNFSAAEADQIIENPFYQEYMKGGYEGALAKAAGTSDTKVVQELMGKMKASGMRFDKYLNTIALNPAAVSSEYGKLKAEEAKKAESEKLSGLREEWRPKLTEEYYGKPGAEGTSIVGRQIGTLQSALGEQQTKATDALSRELAKRGLSYSGNVGAGTADLAEKYAKALSEGTGAIQTQAQQNILGELGNITGDISGYGREQSAINQQQLLNALQQNYAKQMEDERYQRQLNLQEAAQPEWWESLLGGIGGAVQTAGGGLLYDWLKPKK